ncbi:nucleotidyltransferase family protein [Synechococcus sp. MIT S9452]|uniref:nucleotidyltransferase family protein n=1 Tax=Synechococcus sp. MIT S9452 TaxID=3082546 RepID=UPI0039A6056D
MHSFNALVLAAGYGTRLRPLTLSIPKCLVQINGKPLLQLWLNNLEKSGCENAYVNTHYLRNNVAQFLKQRKNNRMLVQEIYEDKLLGTAGTLIKNQDLLKGSTCVMLHADNATDFNISELVNAHLARPKHCELTMLTFTTDNPRSCGIIETDENNIVHQFHEKVPDPPSDRANGAIYVFESSFIQQLNSSKDKIKDFSTQVIPKMLGKIYAWHTSSAFIDIGTPESLEKARKIWGE